MFAMTRFGNIQVISVYSGTSVKGTPSEPGKVSPEHRLGWGLLKYIFLLFCL